ncbi:MAG TPA: branched-chain amino acid ABC transporter permease [Chloroflexota bacterium]
MSLRQRLGLSAAAVAILAALGLVAPSYYVGLMTLALVYAVFAMSLNVLVGYTGLQSLGHAAFFGTGAYATAITFHRFSQSFVLDLLAALAASAFVAAVFGVLALRATGAYFLMATLALAQVLWGLALGLRQITGGDDGLPGTTRPGFGPLDLASGGAYFLFVLVIFVCLAVAMAVFVRSPFGSALQGIRESETRMRMLGYNTWLYKYVAFLIAGTLAGLSGALYVYYTGFVSTTEISVLLSAEALLMVILGGPGTLLGPLLGAAAVVFLRNYLSSLPVIGERWLFVLGVVYVLTVLVASRGIVGEVEVRLRRRRATAGA